MGDERLAGGMLSDCFRQIWGIRDVLRKRLVFRPWKLEVLGMGTPFETHELLSRWEIWVMRDLLGAWFRSALDRFGASAKWCGQAFGMLGGPWGPLEVLEGIWGSFGVSWDVLGHPWGPWECPGSVLGGP